MIDIDIAIANARHVKQRLVEHEAARVDIAPLIECYRGDSLRASVYPNNDTVLFPGDVLVAAVCGFAADTVMLYLELVTDGSLGSMLSPLGDIAADFRDNPASTARETVVAIKITADGFEARTAQYHYTDAPFGVEWEPDGEANAVHFKDARPILAAQTAIMQGPVRDLMPHLTQAQVEHSIALQLRGAGCGVQLFDETDPA